VQQHVDAPESRDGVGGHALDLQRVTHFDRLKLRAAAADLPCDPANAWAPARPMPGAAPVMMAILPVRRDIVDCAGGL
jgi:hypothetical protein